MSEARTDSKKRRLRRIRRWVLVSAVVVVGPPLGYYLYWTVLQTNFHVVAEGQVYRSAQPSADQIRRWANDYGIKTVINLRGGKDQPFWKPNHEAAEQAGVTMIDFFLSAVRLPTREKLRHVIEALETAERPMLIHCAHGADRAGVVSVIAAMAVAGQDYQTARKQLSIRYLHVYHGTDRVGGVMDRYEEYCRRNGLSTAGWKQFRQWAFNEYRKDD